MANQKGGFAMAIAYWVVLALLVVPAFWILAGVILWIISGGRSDPPKIF
ncbi:hypothetical protein [Sulfobacillus thermosulfidooxidans]|nr:hypothetical protein [Sulfobacillus thermosulfidooxidans]